MVYQLADNITSPLGMTSAQNYQAVKAGRSALAPYSNLWEIPEPFTAALFSETQWQAMAREGLTRFESLVMHSVTQALEGTSIDSSSPRVVFILSTTKANIELLGNPEATPELLHPGESARRIAKALGLTTEPVVVCNACVSGLSALILAERLLTQRQYDYAIVCGADILSRFVISGFQSFKSMDAQPCRPYDIERLGMNLGEAAATMILAGEHTGTEKGWALLQGTIRNDAHHISNPSHAMMPLLQQIHQDELALVNAHGTATMFMDQMEAVALHRAGLSETPVNSYKGYFGHTLGAAGVLETILTIQALNDQSILGTRGFQELGVSVPIQVSAEAKVTDKKTFLKLISGFGGTNAALLVSAEPQAQETPQNATQTQQTHRVVITPEGVTIDGQPQTVTTIGKALLTELYRTHVGDYPKFYKMDGLSKLGFLAAELMTTAEAKAQATETEPQPVETEQRAVILFNHSSSIDTDQQYLASIRPEDYFPSPSLFVYTLPNIVTGEIAIRHHLHGETSFYNLASRQEPLISQIQQAALADTATRSLITGWIDYEDEAHFCADMYILETTPTP